ncbi:hypothetical protein [Sphingomonas sabuli]|uniref:hypothetical protein n=1 Tax=Sphingomonas sabuli TaxID=2764186 RepID=UPI0031B5D090
MIDGNPVEPGAEVLFHLFHETPCERPQIIILIAIFRRDDDPKLVPVVRTPFEECATVTALLFCRIEFAGRAVALHAVALKIAKMGPRAADACSTKPDQPGFHNRPALAERREPAAATEQAGESRAAADPTAVKAPAARACPLPSPPRRPDNARKIGSSATATAAAHPANKGFEVVAVGHGRCCSIAKQRNDRQRR